MGDGQRRKIAYNTWGQSVHASHEIVCDNGTQFVGRRTNQFCRSWGIKLVTSTLGYPKANGQAESSNKIVMECIKKKLDSKKGRWAEELPLVLWADRTTPKTSTG